MPDLSDIRQDIRDIREALTRFAGEVNGEFREVRSEMKTDFRILFGSLISVALGLAALLAHGFKWI